MRAEDLVEVVVGFGVMAFLFEERLHLGAERRVFDLIEVMVHRADEEPFAVGKQHVDAVRDGGGGGVAGQPVPRDLG